MARLRAILTSPASVGLVAALLAAVASGAGRGGGPLDLLERAERATLDARFLLRGPRASTGQVALVLLDDATLSRRPRILERRAELAELVRAIHRAGPKAIAIDLFFDKAEAPLSEALTADIRGRLERARLASEPDTEDLRLLRRVDSETRGDETLAAALRAARPVVLALHAGGRGGSGAAPSGVSKGRYGQFVPGGRSPPVGDRIFASRREFNRAASALGLVTVFTDLTGKNRGIPLAIAHAGAVYAPLALQLAARFWDVPRSRLGYLGPEGVVRAGERTFELGEDGTYLIDLLGPAGTVPSYSAVDVLEGRVSEELEGRIVLVGVAHLVHDTVATSFGPMPGVEFHAQAVDNLLSGRRLRRAAMGFDLAATFLFGALVTGLVGLRLGPLWLRLAGVFLAAFAWVGVCQVALGAGWWWPVVGPILSGGLVLPLTLAAWWRREGRQRAALRRTFAHYLHDSLIEDLVRHPQRVRLGGERRELTVLFSDIRDFTTLSERLEPEVLVERLNTYLTPMTRAVLEHGGYLDKYIGDAVMAVFGAPLEDAAHADNALRTALTMLAALEEVRRSPAWAGAPLSIGIGINTGPMAVGNMGSAERFDYTVVGDSVNLASRLEGLCKTYRVACLVGAGTVAAASSEFAFREIDWVQVKGKEAPVAVYELRREPLAELALWEEGLAAYRAGRFTEARAAFEDFAARHPGDGPVSVHLARLAELGDRAPVGWTGVFAQQHK